MVELQGDMTVRKVHARNLRAMCDGASGMAHRYSMEIGKARATVTYSNPDEYGHECPYSQRFPIVPDGRGGHWVILDMVSELGGRDEDDREAAAQNMSAAVLDAPPMWFNPTTGDWEAAKRCGNLPQFADEAIRAAVRVLERACADGWEDATTGEVGKALKACRITLSVGGAPYEPEPAKG